MGSFTCVMPHCGYVAGKSRDQVLTQACSGPNLGHSDPLQENIPDCSDLTMQQEFEIA